MRNSGLKPQIYGMSIPKSWDLGRNFEFIFLRIFMKKWSFSNSSRIIPGSFPELQGIKKPSKIIKSSLGNAPGASGKNPKKSSENIVLNDFLDLFFQIFPCWRMYCPCGRPLGGRPLTPPRATRGQYMRQHGACKCTQNMTRPKDGLKPILCQMYGAQGWAKAHLV